VPVKLEGKVAMVSGASSGVGRAVALGLAAEGATVCLAGRSAERLAAAAEAAGAGDSRALVYVADLSRDDEVDGLRASVERDVGGLDILVHSAGTISFGSVERAGVEDFDHQYRTNLRSAYLLTQALLPMLKERRGQVVFINSSAGLNAGADSGAYAATKAGLKAIADSLRSEVNADGVRVSSVFLGGTATPMQAAVHSHEGKTYHPEQLIQPEDVAGIVVAALELAPTAEVTEIRIRPAIKPL